MKKNIITFIVGMVAVAAIFYVVLKTDNDLDKQIVRKEVKDEVTSAPLGESIINKEIELLAKELEVEVSKKSLFIKLNNYRLSPIEIIQTSEQSKLSNYLKAMTIDLQKCLKKDLCGMKPDKDGYFDENQTHGHKLMARSLEILNEMDPEELRDMNFEDFLEYNNEKILNNATELFTKSNPSEEELISFLEKTRTLAENYKSTVFHTLLSRGDQLDRKTIIEELASQLREADPYSIVSFYQKLSSLKLDESEVEKISKSGCHLKENEMAWNSFKYNFKKYVESKSMQLTIQEICP